MIMQIKLLVVVVVVEFMIMYDFSYRVKIVSFETLLV